MKEVDEITGVIVDSAVKVHQALGPGLLESVYETILAHELQKRGLSVERQKSVRFDLHEPVGLLISFGAATLKEGLRRVVNNDESSGSPRLRVNQTATKESN